MSARSVTLAAQRAARRNMLDTLRVRTITGVTTDPVTGKDTATYTAVYTGPGSIQTFEGYERSPEVGGATITVQRYLAHLPVGSCTPAIDQVVDVVTAVLDPALAGRSYRVVALLHKSKPSAYRLGVEES